AVCDPLIPASGAETVERSRVPPNPRPADARPVFLDRRPTILERLWLAGVDRHHLGRRSRPRSDLVVATQGDSPHGGLRSAGDDQRIASREQRVAGMNLTVVALAIRDLRFAPTGLALRTRQTRGKIHPWSGKNVLEIWISVRYDLLVRC